jgi:hypothetical protein
MRAGHFAIASAFIATSAMALTLTGRSPAQQPNWHCCVYTCYNPNSPSNTHPTYFCHPTADCPALPSNDHSSSEVCNLNGPGVPANSCQECVNSNHGGHAARIDP